MPRWTPPWLGILWFTAGKFGFWFVSVLVLAAFPIGLHLAAIVINRNPSAMGPSRLGDGYLYAFILAMTAFTETLAERRERSVKTLTILYVFTAVGGAIGYFASSIEYITQGPFNLELTVGVLPLIGFTIVAYLFYKTPVLLGAGKTDWEDMKKRWEKQGGL